MQEHIETIDLRSTSFAPNLDNNGVLLLPISLFLVSLQLSLSLAHTMFLGKYLLSLFCLLFTPFLFFHSSHFPFLIFSSCLFISLSLMKAILSISLPLQIGHLFYLVDILISFLSFSHFRKSFKFQRRNLGSPKYTNVCFAYV